MTEQPFELIYFGVTVEGTVRRYGSKSFYYLNKTNEEPIPYEDPIHGIDALKLYCKHYQSCGNHKEAIFEMMKEVYYKNLNK